MRSKQTPKLSKDKRAGNFEQAELVGSMYEIGEMHSGSQKMAEKDLELQNDYDMLSFLDKRDPQYRHTYKKFQNHSLNSELDQIQSIIKQLLNQHRTQGKLSASDQYTLSGYLAKYFIFAENDPSLMEFFRNITAGIQFDESLKSPRFFKRENTNMSNTTKVRLNSKDDKRQELIREFQKVKFLWKLCQLKTTVCPKIRSDGETTKTNNLKELTAMSVRLNELDKTSSKIGEEKMLSQIDKLLKKLYLRFRLLLF